MARAVWHPFKEGVHTTVLHNPLQSHLPDGPSQEFVFSTHGWQPSGFCDEGVLVAFEKSDFLTDVSGNLLCLIYFSSEKNSSWKSRDSDTVDDSWSFGTWGELMALLFKYARELSQELIPRALSLFDGWDKAINAKHLYVTSSMAAEKSLGNWRGTIRAVSQDPANSDPWETEAKGKCHRSERRDLKINDSVL